MNIPIPSLVITAPYTDILARAHLLPALTNTEAVELCKRFHADAKTLVDQIKVHRETLTKPYLEAQRALIAKEKELTAPILALISGAEQALAEYLAETAAEESRRAMIAQEEARQIQAAEELAGQTRGTPPIVTYAAVADVAHVPTRKVAKLVVTDTRNIPPEFMVVDEAKLLLYLKSGMVCDGAHLEYETRITKAR
jgi:DNA replication initiation complex subunit (GINS family)